MTGARGGKEGTGRTAAGTGGTGGGQKTRSKDWRCKRWDRVLLLLLPDPCRPGAGDAGEAGRAADGGGGGGGGDGGEGGGSAGAWGTAELRVGSRRTPGGSSSRT